MEGYSDLKSQLVKAVGDKEFLVIKSSDQQSPYLLDPYSKQFYDLEKQDKILETWDLLSTFKPTKNMELKDNKWDLIKLHESSIDYKLVSRAFND